MTGSIQEKIEETGIQIKRHTGRSRVGLKRFKGDGDTSGEILLLLGLHPKRKIFGFSDLAGFHPNRKTTNGAGYKTSLS